MKTSISARSPLSPTLWPRDAFTWWKSLGLALLLYLSLVFAVTFFRGVALGFGAAIRDLQTLSWPIVAAQLVAYAFPLAALVAFLPEVAQRPLRELGLRRPRTGDVWWGIGGAVVMIVVTAGVGGLQQSLFHVKADEVQVQWLRTTHGPLLAAFAALACVAAPFFEELVFRGFIFNALLRYVPVPAAVLVSAALFGVSHLGPGNEGAIVPLAASGAVLAVVYYRSGSLVASMLTHALFNAATFFAVGVLHQT